MNRIEKSAQVMASLGVCENDLAAAFPEFEAVRNRFVYAEARTQGELDDRRRALVVVACLATLEADDLAEQMHAAMAVGVTPVELQEVFHQVVPYIGLPRAEHGLRVLAEVLRAEGVSLPLPQQSTTDEGSRLEKGIHAQSAIFGEDHILTMRASAPEDQAFMQDYLSAYCFGDTYTRNGLELETRASLLRGDHLDGRIRPAGPRPRRRQRRRGQRCPDALRGHRHLCALSRVSSLTQRHGSGKRHII